MMEIYAELLSNIRQVSLAVSLSTPSDASTRVMVAADGKQVQLSHHGEARQLEIPAKIALGATSLTIQKHGVKAFSWRLPLDADVLTQIPPSHHAISLWSATDLDSGTGVHCRKCDTTIVGPNSVTWKDLPSENWAEMMEFWHCHKPHEHSHNRKDAAGKADEASLAARGYGASSTISAQKSIGFVDLTTLLFAESDCHDLTVSGVSFVRVFFRGIQSLIRVWASRR
jgi:ubiquitin-protein ligase E3 D